MSIFVLSYNDRLLVASAGIMLSIGVFLTVLSVFGIVCLIISKMKRFYSLVPIFATLIMILAFICGFLPIFRFVKNGMKNQLRLFYDWESKLGMEWNRVQVKKRCCGIDGPWDYLETNWFTKSNPDSDNPTVYVPDSCCALNFNQDREITWVDPQKLQLRDARRCQEDAIGRVKNSVNINTKGCFVALFTKNPDLWHDQSIWVVMDVITAVCLITATFQVVFLICNSLLSKMRTRSPKS
ncbi:hypothetical protein HELRODRAFT_174367 [Helobdella robusta]|uniref:Tetraspanin n=1 Tax=Helobdella robusta TaxID=6412 RepID=T1F817_HELRO|nr:hypothetical protein HELRODRAFT_174367 [Helobdella robusta]ESO02907.1 hypothetical protein HELRODRAFT_174367 [Helobdella robusta]